VQVDLYKGLKLQTQTGTSTTGSGQASSVGLTYQFNY
jgi:translocation and assembly module TamB